VCVMDVMHDMAGQEPGWSGRIRGATTPMGFICAGEAGYAVPCCVTSGVLCICLSLSAAGVRGHVSRSVRSGVHPSGGSAKGGISAVDGQNHIIMDIVQNSSFAGLKRPWPQKPEAGILFHPLRGVVPDPTPTCILS
jgi:hypothetical protein